MPSSISLSQGPDSFSLALGPRFRLDHSPSHPLLRAGRGQSSYTSRLGSYKVRSRAEGLGAFSAYEVLETGPERVRIHFPGLATLVASASSAPSGLDSLSLGFENIEADYNRLVLAVPAQARDRIYGCGEQYSFLDLRGRRVPLWCEEQGVGRGPNAIRLAAELAAGAGGNRLATYYPIPAFLSSAGWSCCCRLKAWARFDFRHLRVHRLLFWEIPQAIDFEVCAEESAGARPWDPAALVGGLSLRLGRQSPPPAWAFEGLILGVQGGTEEILRKAEVLEKAGTPLAGLWAQDWCGRRLTSFGSQLLWNWEADPGLYPDLGGLARSLSARGLRLLGYINPFLAPEGRLYAEARALGLCAKDAEGRDYLLQTAGFPAAVLDLTKPEARTWIKGIIKAKLLGQGLSGWMADFGEYLPTDAVLASGEAAELVHNAYPVLWAQVNAEAVAEAGKEGEVLWFCRSGGLGSSRYAPCFWAGDQNVDWSRDDGLASVIPAALSLGLQGSAFWHADLGGYTTVAWLRRSRELLCRWAELSAFTPLMRSHEGNRPTRNAQAWSDPATAAAVAAMARVHAALAPYTRALAEEYGRTGLPLMRALFLAYPEDPRCENRAYEYLYGPDLLVAPVLRPGRRHRLAYVPPGDWLELWTGEAVRPGWRLLRAPLGRIPVIYRRASPWAGLFASLAAVAASPGEAHARP